MYCIICKNVYFHEKGKVILFDTIEEAQYFANEFFKFAIERAAQTEGITGPPRVLMAMNMETSIVEWDENSKMPSKTFDEIKKERGI